MVRVLALFSALIAALAVTGAGAAKESFDLAVIGAERKNGGPFAMSAKAYHIIKSIDPPVLVVMGQQPDLRRVLGFETGYEIDGFLKAHNVYEDYRMEDFEREREALKSSGF